MNARKRAIFCDFDGTITMSDNIVAVMKHFDPDGWKVLVQDIMDQRISIRQGVGALFRLLPSARRDEIVHYAIQNAVIRPGFPELLAYCRANDIDFYVTSGGIDFFIHQLLAPFDIEADHIYCNASDFSGPSIEIMWPHPCDEQCTNDCGMCKSTIMRQFSGQSFTRYVIGDSVTDFEAAKLADHVFARAALTPKCAELGIPYDEFATFFDVIDRLEELHA